VLLAPYLDVYVFVVVFMQTCYRSFVADPEVDGVRFAFKGNTRECDVLRNILKDVCVLVT
jgi:hypothetical protein